MKKPMHVVVLAIVIYILVAVGGYMLLARPQLDQTAALQQTRSALEQEVAKREQLEADRDRQQAECMEDLGWTVIRFAHHDDWDAILERHKGTFGGHP